MIDRQQLETVLQRRFPNASLEQIAAAANAIIALENGMRSADCPICASRRGVFGDGTPGSYAPPGQP